MRGVLAVLVMMMVLTACGAQGAPAVQPAATVAANLPGPTSTATVTATATVAAGVPATTVAPSVATVGATPLATAPAAATATAATPLPAPTEYTADNGDRVLGQKSAPITMLDYSDFQ